jgi:hypothetical protein
VKTAPTPEDEDLALSQRCARSEEELREYRRFVPWRGEYRFFRSPNVVCLEHYRLRPPAKPERPTRYR